MASKHKIVTGKEDNVLVEKAANKIMHEWPEFMLHDPVADLFDNLYRDFPQYQFVLVDDVSGKPLAIGNSIPLAWEGMYESLPEKGWDWALTKGVDDLKKEIKPTILCALQIVVFGENRGIGLSKQMVMAMSNISKINGLNGLIAPVRPNLKAQYPLIPMEEYIIWKNNDNMPFDPWLRVHVSLGGSVIKTCHEAMIIQSSIADWEEWTGINFPGSGKYVVPGALVPIVIDKEKNVGTYVEPNIWTYHAP